MRRAKTMKIALVTGASRGLGAEIAYALGVAGWGVAVNYAHDGVNAEKVVRRIEKAQGHAVAVRFDITDDAAVETGVEEISRRLGAVDLLVNNATGPQPTIPIMQQTWQDHLNQLVFFVKAPTKLLQTVLPDWRARKSGRVINIGSEAFDIGNPEFAHYVAAKGAMIGLTRSWATELGRDDITVNLVAPGFIPTERHDDVGPEARAEYAERVPLGRQGVPPISAG